MSKPEITKEFGRQAFGKNPAAYHAIRPGYPEWVYATLASRCGLQPGIAVLEIGAGTGIATRRLLELGARPLIAVEPDPFLATFLRVNNTAEALQVIPATFEDLVLDREAFDLGVCATAFHWLDEKPALAKVAGLLRPGGWWAAMWNVFGDNSRPDPFHEATKELLRGPQSPSFGRGDIPFALDTNARLTALREAGAFDVVDHQECSWTLTLDAEQTETLYSTYSNVNIRPDRAAVLAELRRVARDEFEDRVVRNMITILYVARRANR